MTNYYYLASDQKMGLGNGSLDMTEAEVETIPGFDFPVQVEIVNGVEKAWELRELLQYIQNHMAPYKTCTVQVANLLNSNRVELKVQKEIQHIITRNNGIEAIIRTRGAIIDD